MSKGINSMKVNNKSSKVVQVNNYVLTSVNSGTYVEIGVPTHNQYNSEVSMLNYQKYTSFEVIGEEPIIGHCITTQDLINIYAHGCIQEFYEEYCKLHTDKENLILGRLLSILGIEVWKNITCYNGIYSGLYMVSNLGRVLSLYKNKQPKILKQYDNGRGYLFVKLCYNNKTQNVYVHRLVGLNFIEEPTEPLECCHSNTNSHDNRLFNLDLKTHLENVNNPLTLKKYKDAWATRTKADKESTESASASATE